MRERTRKLAVLIIMLFIGSPLIAQEPYAKLDAYFTQWNRTGRLNGTVLVAEKGRVIYKKGFGYANLEWSVPNTPDTKFKIASITKQFTAIMIIQLIEEGKVKLKGRLTDYLPQYRKETGEKITIDHLLKHMSGIPCYIRKRLMPPSAEPRTKADIIQNFLCGDLEFDPGSKYNYSNSGYFLLGAIIEQVTGMSFEANLRKRILEPLGMKCTGIYSNSRITEKRANGYVKTMLGYENAPQRFPEHSLGSGNMFSTVEDIYLWIEALKSGKLISNEYRDMIDVPYIDINPGLSRTTIWNVRNIKLTKESSSSRLLEFNGWSFDFNTGIHWFSETDHVIIVFSNRGGVDLIEMAIGAMKIVHHLPYSMPKIQALDILTKKVIEKGSEIAFQLYRKMLVEKEDTYDFRYLEFDLNQVGYRLLSDKNEKKAIQVFTLNTLIHPESFNAFDSLAEAYMKSGDNENAILYYKKSLELNPENENAQKMIRELENT